MEHSLNTFHRNNLLQVRSKFKDVRYSVHSLWRFRYGGLLTKHPLVSILACLVIPALSAIGLRNYTTENNPYKLWIPQVGKKHALQRFFRAAQIWTVMIKHLTLKILRLANCPEFSGPTQGNSLAPFLPPAFWAQGPHRIIYAQSFSEISNV